MFDIKKLLRFSMIVVFALLLLPLGVMAQKQPDALDAQKEYQFSLGTFATLDADSGLADSAIAPVNLFPTIWKWPMTRRTLAAEIDTTTLAMDSVAFFERHLFLKGDDTTAWVRLGVITAVDTIHYFSILPSGKDYYLQQIRAKGYNTSGADSATAYDATPAGTVYYK